MSSIIISEYEFQISSVLNYQRARNLYTYFLKTLDFLDLPGHIAEFGVFYGETSHELCKYLNHVRSQRKMLMFDTFSGLPNRGEKDPPGVEFHNYSYTYCDDGTVITDCVTFPDHKEYIATMDSVVDIMDGLNHWSIFPGLIERYRNKQNFDQLIAFAHIDCDLYDGTRDALLICLEQMSKSGYLVVDDYATEWTGVTAACEELVIGLPLNWEIILKEKGQLVARKR